MNRVYLKDIGIFHQHARNSAELSALVSSDYVLDAELCDAYQSVIVELSDKKIVNREDRAVLNLNAKILINALSDFSNKQCLSMMSEAAIYSACDPEEHDNSEVQKVISRDPDNFWENLSILKKTGNPLDLLRILPTNPLYHVSKILKNHSEGIPLRAASLSGMSALKLAHSDIKFGSNNKGALIINSANMCSFNSIVMFEKFGEIRHGNADKSGIIPCWGGIVAYLDHNPESSIAEVLDVFQCYEPSPKFTEQSWITLFSRVKSYHGIPDIIVSYDNGIVAQGEVEKNAISRMFPDTPVLNYKTKTGYGGKINNLTDIACAMADNRIKTGSNVMFNGAGVMHGLGCCLLNKLEKDLQ
ncbi:hypothetical protein [Enterobacter asburiae]|uniref:hypothetical protein n=1 Tax=Enterobacter asburiae TaxID=61645 RepID=UPI0011D2764D|nr:hypothetical protein [Enterobacter asburiae]